MIEAFLENWPSLRERIGGACARQDHQGLRKAAHMVKGSAQVMAAGQVAETARELEALAQASGTAEAGALVEALFEQADTLVVELRRRIALAAGAQATGKREG